MIDKHLAPASMRPSDESLDVRRYLDALRRDRMMIIMFVVAATAAAVLLSSALPEQYKGTARIVLEEPGNPLGTSDSEAIQRQLLTTDRLLTTPRVLERVAARVPGVTEDQVANQVSSEVDDQASIIDVHAVDENPRRAAAIANGVATEFISERTERERERLRRARESRPGSRASRPRRGRGAPACGRSAPRCSSAC